MRTTVLNLTDLDNRIRDYENRFGATSVEMLQDESVRARISEDILLKWETYVRQRSYLREMNLDCHRTYLDHLRPAKQPTKHRQEADDLAYAA